MRWKGLLPITIAAVLAGASPATADTFTVAGTTDVTGPCDGTSCASIRQALAAAEGTSVPDTIRVPAGDYQLTQGALTVDSEVSIVGAGARDTIVHGDSENRVFDVVAPADAVISHLTMRDGHATPSGNFFGGNLANYGGTVVLDHVRVTQGHGYSAGGVANRSGTMTIQYSLIDHNFADNGGSDVGGVMNFGGDGGVPASLTVRDSTVAFNESQLGGGISTSNNTANTLRLERVTIAYNSGGSRTDVPNAGGLSIESGHSVVVAGSIIAGNSTAAGPSNCTPQPITSEGYNLQDGTDCQLAGTGDRQDTQPQFVGPEPALANAGGETDVLRLESSSPAVDLVPGCSAQDQTDLFRPQGAACDAGAFEVDQAPDTVVAGAAPPFTFTAEPGSRFECAIDGGPFAACASPWTPAGVAAGTHTLAVRAIDGAGNVDASPATRSFTVAATPLPAQPTPTPVPTPAPTATPVAGKSVGAEPISGKVLVKLPGSKKFVELDPSVIPNGAEIDTSDGVVEITRSDGASAKFYSGVFKLSQPGGITTATLTEKLDCSKKGKASAAAKKPKTRKLWGDGKGKFRTRGQYSAATVRGTKWLVTDTCTSTITKVVQGLVSVRDEVKNKTILVRKGKSYTARPKR